MKITITGCQRTPRWETLQEVIRQTTKLARGFLTRIRRKDGGCGYREPGEYELTFRDDDNIIPIELVVLTADTEIERGGS